MAYDAQLGMHSPGGIYGPFGARGDGTPFQSAEEAQQYAAASQARNQNLAALPHNFGNGAAYGGHQGSGPAAAGPRYLEDNTTQAMGDQNAGAQAFVGARGGDGHGGGPGSGQPPGQPTPQRRGIDPATGAYYNRQPPGLNVKRAPMVQNMRAPLTPAPVQSSSPMGNALQQIAMQRPPMADGNMGMPPQVGSGSSSAGWTDGPIPPSPTSGFTSGQQLGQGSGTIPPNAQPMPLPSPTGPAQMPSSKGGQQAPGGGMDKPWNMRIGMPQGGPTQPKGGQQPKGGRQGPGMSARMGGEQFGAY